ncbi:VWA domain-containing protein [Candidatus Sulfurimonas marisnigri]|uniref:VWA domain-containing protein n=1 Tax=Candidatus Sulfurimonas marisnigri TaxID=2740405 RepID=A0A7S7M1N3_9BACT|nr:VWA domain-containing protein [Candidatus Sulfurimonas marisnigri]QOY55373.1 VWA domain-containing protein [Candidatus Sulfurimonas marisnigri]
MSFLSPEYFWLLVLILPLFIKKDFRNISITAFGYILTFVLIVLALSRPVIEQEPIKSKQVLSDVVVAVDLSFSMYAQDIEPSRLVKAKEILKELLMSEYKTRFGVLGFTTNAIVLSPLTQDRELLLHLFNSLEEKFISTKGSSVMPALKLARKMSNSKTMNVVLLTDGADEFGYESEALYAKENSMRVNVFMLGSGIGATLRLENGELLKDELGDIVVSRENSAIKEISDATGGVYTKDFSELLEAIGSQKEKDKESETTIIKNLELFYYFVFLAILTFLVSVTTLKKYVLVVLLLVGVNLHADRYTKLFSEANEFYKNGKYEKALDGYDGVKSPHVEFKSIVYYNMGNTYIRLQEFKKAREAYLKSLTLMYSKEADENLAYIKDVSEKKEMKTGQQKTDKKSSLAKKEKSSKEQKEGGGSNMKVSAAASSGDDDGGKKSESKSKIDLNSGKAKLSSKQYELINKRVVNENQPW